MRISLTFTLELIPSIKTPAYEPRQSNNLSAKAARNKTI